MLKGAVSHPSHTWRPIRCCNICGEGAVATPCSLVLLRLRAEQPSFPEQLADALHKFGVVCSARSGLALRGRHRCLPWFWPPWQQELPSVPPSGRLEETEPFPSICSQTFKEVFVRSLADHRDNAREISVTRSTRLAKIVWKSHKHIVPAFNRQKSIIPEEQI